MTRPDDSPSSGSNVREKVIGSLYESIDEPLDDPSKLKLFLVGGRGFGKSLILSRAARKSQPEPSR